MVRGVHVVVVVGVVVKSGEALRQLSGADDTREDAVGVNRVVNRAILVLLKPEAPSDCDVLRQQTQAVVMDALRGGVSKRAVKTLAGT